MKALCVVCHATKLAMIKSYNKTILMPPNVSTLSWGISAGQQHLENAMMQWAKAQLSWISAVSGVVPLMRHVTLTTQIWETWVSKDSVGH